MQIIDDLKAIENQIMDEIDAAQSLADIKAVRVKYLGKKGPITEALRGMRDLSAEERPQVGAYANELKAKASTKLSEKEELLSAAALEAQLQAEAIDVTLPGEKPVTGTKHVLTQVMEEIEDLFVSMGYEVVEGPEIESDFYNFERMNLPKDHPARDMQDTFYINDEVLLRTHTSPVQARAMDAHDFEAGPLKMISPGKVYRRDDDDATHSHQFHQIEGLVVDRNVSLADLKGTLELFARHMFGEETEVRLRPSYFPFTEPSAEVDIMDERGKWLEVLGCGMVHPNVLRAAGIDPEQYKGFAFGLGVERFAMLRYGINDLRMFYQNDVRFLRQFA